MQLLNNNYIKMPEENNSMRYAGLATQWMAMLGLGAWLGYKLDKWLGWQMPLFVILFPLIALFVSLWGIIKEVSKKK